MSSPKTPTLSIIVPALNEEKGLSLVLKKLLALSRKIGEGPLATGTELVVVDDGSRDRTAQVASQFQGVTVLRNQKTLGYGAAIKIGFEASHGELLAFLDADDTYPPEALQEMLAVLFEQKADMVIGSRSFFKEGMPLNRKLGNIFLNRVTSWLMGRPVLDSTSGMRLLRREAWMALDPLPDGLAFTPSMTAQALYKGLKIACHPIPYHERVGRSKLNPKDSFSFLFVTLRAVRRYDPLRFLLSAGVGLCLAALLTGLALRGCS